MTITSPTELLLKIQNEIGTNVLNSIPVENEDYAKHMELKAKAQGINSDDLKGGVDNLIKGFWEDINMLPEREHKLIQEKIAIGNARIDSVRARLVKQDEFYCIIFNFGLYIYLNKYLKLLHASQIPKDVTYCNRIEREDYSAEIFAQYRDELSHIYINSRSVKGAMIILKPDVVLPGLQLRFIELFILCHELGHFFNGDLENKAVTTSLYKNSEEKILDDLNSRQMEHNADIRGFELLLKILVARNRIKLYFPPVLILNTLILNFNIFTELAPKDITSHPHPINRLLHIVDAFYGKDAADFINKTYEIPGYVRQHQSTFFEISNRLNKYFH